MITSSIEYVPTDIVHIEYPAVTLPISFANNMINNALPNGQEQIIADPLEAPMAILTYIWIIGVIFLMIYAVISYINIRKKLITSSPLYDNIYLADEIPSPFVMGLFKPKIYLPSDISEHEKTYIIMHEKYHIKRFDHIIKALYFIALCIHWFNPLVWLSFILAGRDMEMSCDEAVINKLGDNILADYSTSLLSFATGRHIITGSFLTFGEGDTKGRIHNLIKWKKPKVWAILISIVLCIIIGVSLLTNPALSFNKSNNNQTENISQMENSEIIEDLSYYLELACLGLEFEDMKTENQKDILYEYSQLFDNYLLLPRQSKDGTISYIIGCFNGDTQNNPFSSLSTIEYSDANKTVQLLYQKKDENKVNNALSISEMPNSVYVLNDSHIYYIPESGIIMIEPNYTASSLTNVFTKYFEPNGREYILDAVSRGISLTSLQEPYISIYLISEKYGEITENIPLSELDAKNILSENRVSLSDGFGFCASLHKDNETFLFSDTDNIPESVIDLAVEKCGYKFSKPSDITGSIIKAKLECDWLNSPIYAKETDLKQLEQILKDAEYDSVNGCGYNAKLTITLSNDEELTLFKGCDNCDTLVFGSYSGYVIGEKQNEDFWEIFGLDADTKKPLF